MYTITNVFNCIINIWYNHTKVCVLTDLNNFGQLVFSFKSLKLYTKGTVDEFLVLVCKFVSHGVSS